MMEGLAVSPGVAAASRGAPAVSLLSLYLLRAGYLLMAVVLCGFVWPMVMVHTSAFALTDGVRTALLAGLGAAALLGLRYPLQMLPILLFEFAWKATFLVAFAWPLWAAHKVDDAVASDVFGCCLQAIVIPLVPWRYVYSQYVVRAGVGGGSVHRIACCCHRRKKPGISTPDANANRLCSSERCRAWLRSSACRKSCVLRRAVPVLV